jgi:hypothetical protein
MKILLQHVRSQLYVQTPEKWTPNPFEALDFQDSQSAIDFARDYAIAGVQIAVKFLDSQFDEIVTLPPFHHDPPRPRA